MQYLALILMVLTNAGETIGYKNATEKSSVVAFGVTLWSTIISLPIGFALMFFAPNNTLGNFVWGQFGWLILLSFLGIATIVCWAKASQNLPMSIAEGVSEIYIALLAVVCWIFFGKALHPIQIILVSLVILFCLALAFVQGSPKTNTKYNTKVGFIFISIWVVLSVIKGALPAAVTQLGIVTFILVQNGIMLFVTSIYNVKCLKSCLKLVLSSPAIMLVGMCRVISQVCVFYLATRMNLGVADAVSVCGLVLIMLYERLIFKERINPYCYPILILLTIATVLLCLV